MTGQQAAVALVTGASRGIGREVVRQLAARGTRVVAGVRDESAGRALKAFDGDIHVRRLDVTDEESIGQTAGYVERTFGRLDVLVNNAGISGITIGQRRSIEELTVDRLREVFETNVFGACAVTQAMLAMLRRADGRVVNISSGYGSFANRAGAGAVRADLLPYCSSKTALNMLTLLYAQVLAESGVTCFAMSPGYVATDLNNGQGSRTVAKGAAAVLHVIDAPAADLPPGGFVDEHGTLPW